MNYFKTLIPFTLLFICLSSCQSLLMSVTGIHNPKKVTNEEIMVCAKQFAIENENVYVIDTISYWDFVADLKKTDSLTFKNLMQPLQMKIFSGKDSLLCYLLNCNVGGLPNLKWNRYHSLETFPPTSPPITPVKYTLPLNKDTQFYKPIKTIAADSTPDATVVVFWSKMMGRQSKVLINEALAYRNRFKQYHLRILFVNTDNLYL
jgi:hypothetical protein